VDIVDDRGRVLEDLRTIIRLVGDAGAVLASGHISGAECVAAFEYAAEAGVHRLLVTHPPNISEVSFSQARELVSFGAFLEHTIMGYDELSHRKRPISQLVEWLKEFGPAHSVISSDFGLAGRGMPGDAYIRLVDRLLGEGFSGQDVRTVVSTNPSLLLT